ncbi:MAG: DNA primase [Syntrophobacterales bacterium]|nr:DNA primase [Syntrophobacterales bacterium]
MKGHIPEEKIEEVKARANIVDVVSEYVTLKKTGRNFVGLCPFHREKTPSFTVNPEKQIFRCFGCGESGNTISFLMKMNNMSFPEAVRHLAGKLGITIPIRDMSGQEKKIASEREKLGRINQMAAEYFSGNLSSNMGKAARDYLKERGIDDFIVKKFRLGYSREGWRNLKDFFDGEKIPLELVEKAGLIISKGNGKSYYDRFRNRLIFPIMDLNGSIVAFGGRVIDKGEPKYLNSPESPVYIKGKTLYGLYQTKMEISKKNDAIIVEGYLDFLSLWGAGVTNVVATLGTALTKDQVELIRRFSRNVAVIFDPDEAGRHAVERSLQLFLEKEMRARVVILPEDCDPDDYVRRFGGEALEDIISHSPSMIDYYIEKIIGGKGTLEETLDSVKDSVSFIRNISNLVQRNLFIKRVSEKLGVDQEVLKTEVNKKPARYKNLTAKVESHRKEVRKVDMVELNLISIMIQYPEKIPVVVRENTLDFFYSPELKKLGEILVEAFKRGKVKSVSDLVDDLEDDVLKDKILKSMMEQPPLDATIIDKSFLDTIIRIRGKWYKNKREIIQREITKAQGAGNTELSEKLVIEKDKLLKEEMILMNL